MLFCTFPQRKYCFSIIVFIISAARCLKEKIRRINQSRRQEQKRGTKIKDYYNICTCESLSFINKLIPDSWCNRENFDPNKMS